MNQVVSKPQIVKLKEEVEEEIDEWDLIPVENQDAEVTACTGSRSVYLYFASFCCASDARRTSSRQARSRLQRLIKRQTTAKMTLIGTTSRLDAKRQVHPTRRHRISRRILIAIQRAPRERPQKNKRKESRWRRKMRTFSKTYFSHAQTATICLFEIHLGRINLI